MTYISSSHLPVLPAAPEAAKPAPAPASSSPSETAPAASVDLSPAAKQFLGAGTNNIIWGSSPER